MPLYYRMVAGDVGETKALKITLEESGIQEAIVIGDKGWLLSYFGLMVIKT